MTWNPETRWDIQDLFAEFTDKSDAIWSKQVDYCAKYRDKKRVAIAQRREAMDPKERKSRNREALSEWRKAHPERWAEIQKRYQEKNSAKIEARKQDPERRRLKAEKSCAYRARKKLEQCVQSPSNTSSPAPSSSTV